MMEGTEAWGVLNATRADRRQQRNDRAQQRFDRAQESEWMKSFDKGETYYWKGGRSFGMATGTWSGEQQNGKLKMIPNDPWGAGKNAVWIQADRVYRLEGGQYKLVVPGFYLY